jgi:hypothetical protein
MAMSYTPPVAGLLSLGEPDDDDEDWLDYRARGLGPEHVPDLLRMVEDEGLNEGDPDGPEVWAPLHAWRALAQIGDPNAVRRVLDLLDREEYLDDEWLDDDVPEIVGLTGPAILPAVKDFLSSPDHDPHATWTVADGLVELADRYPEVRDECVRFLVERLDHAEEYDPIANGGMIDALVEMEAQEAAPAIERAFETGNVDESAAGDWWDIQFKLGLIDELPDAAPRRPHRARGRLAGPAVPFQHGGLSPKQRADQRRKQAKKKKRKKK